MAPHIQQLTIEQAAQLAGIRDEWIAHGLSTMPADRELAVAGVNAAYQAAGLEPPRIVIWLDSPMAGVIGSAYLAQILKDPAQVGDQVWAQVHRACWGQHDYWLSFYDTFHRFGLPGTDRITGLVQTAQHAGWWWPFRDAVILTERPIEIHRDNQGRLHCETGPAMRYPDDWSIYAWHGTRVPADLVTPGWDAKRVFAEENSEIRRCAVEKLAATDGWERIVADLDCPQVGSTVADPGNPGQVLRLYRLENVYDEPVGLLLMTNGTVERDGTRHEFGETVPASISDPVAAAAWQIGISPANYRLTARRT